MDVPESNRPAKPPGYGIIDSVDGVTDVVLAAMSGAPNPRLRTVMAAFVRHLHAFAREVGLTQDEYDLAIDFLNRIGKTTNDTHNEGVLFADAVGLSTLVCLVNNSGNRATETEAALLGPFWRDNSPLTANGGSIVRSPTPGPALFVDCRITDPAGRPIAEVEVDVWQASPVGLYENQDPNQADMNLRGRFHTKEDGRFWFRSVKPAGYPVPTHGPTGDMLRAQHRHPYRPAHLHVLGFKPGYRTLITQVFADDDELLQSDVVFSVTRALIGKYRRHEGDETPPAPDVQAPWYTLGFHFVMQPGEARRPIPPIK
ncbi:MAG: catechol 1,2-dioxygenase [Alphaproteobacteria bacterium]|nr:catechol 1,2-dioxygenase [Alphaproteobacteria bacterium]